MTAVDAEPHLAALRTHLEQELLVAPDVTAEAALADGETTLVFAVHRHDRFQAWRAAQEEAGTWETARAEAAERERACRDNHEAEVQAADDDFAAAEEAYARDPSEDNQAVLEEAEISQAQFASEVPDCDPWVGRSQGHATLLSGFRIQGEEGSRTVSSAMPDVELDTSGLPLEEAEVSTRDLDGDGRPEVVVLYRHPTQFEDNRGGDVQVYSTGEQLLVVDTHGAVMLDALVSEDTDYAMHMAYFTEEDGSRDFIRVRWDLGAGCACDEDALPGSRQRELNDLSSALDEAGAFNFRRWTCEDRPPADPEDSGACTVTESRDVRRFDGQSRRWTAP
ncbi:MAG: hypothetical protein AB8I08_04965 [Sandaracinaceae bacterium]